VAVQGAADVRAEEALRRHPDDRELVERALHARDGLGAVA
jgi:hypothetical protein